MERYPAKWTCFAWEARQSPEIGANTTGQDTLRQPALAFAEFATPGSGALYHRARKRQSTPAGQIAA